MVMEAVYLKVQKEDEQAAKEHKIKNWRKDTSSLDKFR